MALEESKEELKMAQQKVNEIRNPVAHGAHGAYKTTTEETITAFKANPKESIESPRA